MQKSLNNSSRKGDRIVFITILSGFILFACSGTGSREGRESDAVDASAPALEQHVGSLDRLLHESSGLIFYNGKLWTINDSGGEPVLVGLDYQSGRILQGIRLENAENADWESLAQDDEYIYICDVGNNMGRRETLTIYKVAKASIPPSGSAIIDAEIIKYRYKGRTAENNPVQRSSYDCEAAFVYGDSLYLFTKDWQTHTSTLYTCPTRPGSYEIEPRVTYPVNGLITGIDFNARSNSVILCGYSEFIPFVIIYEDFNPTDYSHGKSHRFNFPEFMKLQTEGIAFISPEREFTSSGNGINPPERAIISCEQNEYPAALYRLKLPATGN